MKKLIFLPIILILLMTSCQKDKEKEKPILEENQEYYVEQETIKEIKVFDDTGDNYALLDIYNNDLRDLTDDDYEFKLIYIDEKDLRIPPSYDYMKNADRDNSESLEVRSDFLIKDVFLKNMIEDYVGISVDVKHDSDISLRGRSAHYHESVRCVNNGTAVIEGFTGNPQNCDHVDWEFKQRRWYGWQKVFDQDTDDENDVILYLNTSMNHSRYQMRIDPNGSCNTYPSHFFLIRPEQCTN